MINIKKHCCLFFALSMLMVIKTGTTEAQSNVIDNGNYIVYPDNIMARIYFLQKFAPFTISSPYNEDLNYKTNSKLNFGVGATYKSYTLNLAYGFNFLNKDKGSGTTKGLDFQFHIYPKTWAVDLLGSFRKGYYMDPKDNNGLNLSSYYVRPDFKRNVTGLSVFRVPNSGRFSYRAAFNQIDWQTKSAGSLLYGGEAYYANIKGDSALVPVKVNSIFPQAGVNRINSFSIGPGIGYAYTLVLHKNFFITGSAVASVDLNFSTEEISSVKNKKVSVIPGGIYKGAIGYNSSTWSVSANITGNALYAGSESSTKEYFLPTGNLRFIVAKRFGSGN